MGFKYVTQRGDQREKKVETKKEKKKGGLKGGAGLDKKMKKEKKGF